MKSRTSTRFVSTLLTFIGVLWLFTSPAVVLASGNFLPLMRIKGNPVNEVSQIKVHEIYQRSVEFRSTELRGFSGILNGGDAKPTGNSDMQPVRSDSFYAVLPFLWHVVSDKPLSRVLSEFADYATTGEIEFVDLVRIFNIEVIATPRHEFEFVNVAHLIFEIRNLERAVLVELPMHLDLSKSCYFISNAAQVTRELLIELERFAPANDQSAQIKPWLKLIAFQGIEIADARNARALFKTAQVYYELRFGSYIVDSGIQRLGVNDLSSDRFRFDESLTN